MIKNVLLLLFALASFTIACAQSMLCTYKGGYFIRNGNTWYEYRPQEEDAVWNTYTQHSTDDNYYYIHNNRYNLSIPKKNTNNIWIEEGKDNWKVLYTTINVYSYCPVRSSHIYTYNKGFYVKDSNNWKLYIPENKRDGSWATFTQYDKDENYYYIKNSSDDIAIPRKSNNDFYWRKNGKWEKLHTTLALYDALSPNAKSGTNYIASNSSSSYDSNGNNQIYSSNGSYQSNYSGSSNNSQSVISNLPKTWTFQTPIGVYIYTLNKDGSVTTEMRNNCYVCYGSGLCRVCAGMGVRYIVDNVMVCNLCGGTRFCKYCNGKGFKIMNSYTQYGVTIYVDENGNTFIGDDGVGSVGGHSSSNTGSSNRTYIETIEYIPSFGLDDTVYCPTCGKQTQRHVHVKKYR